ncbi:MAG: hypothetical protein WC979_03310 [Candidatus Pacearchaeota archaeon]|jgi:hypothetical protein|nr:hypothetical protein [Clostridia bacterium]
MKAGDRVKTPAWVAITDASDYLFGRIESIKTEECLDGTIFEKIMVKFENGQTLPCLREELTEIKEPLIDANFYRLVRSTLKIVPKAYDMHGQNFNCDCHLEITDKSYSTVANKYGISLMHAKECIETLFGFNEK